MKKVHTQMDSPFVMLNKASKHDRKLDRGGEVGCILIASPQQTTHQTQHKNKNK